MLRRSAKTMITTAGIVGVLGVGVAVAADQPTCPNGNTPKVDPDADRHAAAAA